MAQPAGIPPPGDLFFAYGTLKRGGQYHHLLGEPGTEFVGRARLLVPYPLLLAEYPCLLDQPGKGHRVAGEVFRIRSPRQWQLLDQLEGHPHEYRRRPEAVEVDGREVKAWTYFYLEAGRLDPSLQPVDAYPVDQIRQ